MDYAEFLASKQVAARPQGVEAPAQDLSPLLFDWQREVVSWALRVGRAALFEDCGLGKTAQQLEWARLVCRHTGGAALILAPLAVAQQTAREGQKFNIPVTVCRSQADVREGVNVTNYEMLHHFDPRHFHAVVLDESSILKAYMGATKRAIIEAFRETPFRLACTATPAPNDHLELGNHAEFLGVMPSNEMISRWFINDSMTAGNYRLKRHAEKDFWRWVCSWAVSLSRPSDLGYPDAGFDLPPLELHSHVVEVDTTKDAGDALFRDATLSATTMHREMRLTTSARAARVAELVNAEPDEPWLVWCNTNYEADALKAVLPAAAEVRGSDSLPEKERRLEAFTAGESRLLITKPSICGFGMNFQHCRRMAFVGLSYSYEALYQALRRSWRFGQTHPVQAHLVMAETEGRVLQAIQEKREAHQRMQAAMVAAMRETQLGGEDGRRSLRVYEGVEPLALPAWLRNGRNGR